MPESTPYGRGSTDAGKARQDRQTPGRDAGDEDQQHSKADNDRVSRTGSNSRTEESPGCGCGSNQENTEVSAGGDETSIDSNPHPSNPEA